LEEPTELSWWWPLMALGASAPVIAVAGVIGFRQLTSPGSQISQAQPLVISKSDLRRIVELLKYFTDDLERRAHDAEWHGLTAIRVPDIDEMSLETANEWVYHAKSSASKMRRAITIMSIRGVEEITVKPPLKATPTLPTFTYVDLIRIRRYLQYFGDSLMKRILEEVGFVRGEPLKTIFHPVLGWIEVEKAERLASSAMEYAEKIDKLIEMMRQEGVEKITLPMESSSYAYEA
jgi:hypothetical protein